MVRGKGNAFAPRELSLNQTRLTTQMDSENKCRSIYYRGCSTDLGQADLFGSSFINRVKCNVLLEKYCFNHK